MIDATVLKLLVVHTYIRTNRTHTSTKAVELVDVQSLPRRGHDHGTQLQKYHPPFTASEDR